MKEKITSGFKSGFIYFCIFYTITTIFSSSLQLYMGRLEDTNTHILNRAVVVFIGVLTIILMDRIQFKSKILSFLIPYAISMSVVFFYVWISGFFETLHPNAYRDIFLNFTGAVIFVTIIMSIKDKWKKKGEKCDYDSNKHHT
ncbi:MAG: hypothetical protein GX306_05970 [Clostridiales bacterium]|nr:hypothetical protein [Clostridiales bacterium]